MGRRMYVTPIATRETAHIYGEEFDCCNCAYVGVLDTHGRCARCASEAVRSVHTRGVVHSVARNTTTTRKVVSITTTLKMQKGCV